MSWRTQGEYKGLGPVDRDWLSGFDREWDTKARGRSRTDAFEHLTGPERSPTVVCPRTFLIVPRLMDIPADQVEREDCLEVKLQEVAGRVARFTVPRLLKSTYEPGWSIHLELTCGKRVRVRFPDRSAAFQAYVTLQEFSLAMTAS
jgi:hypothetical protein